MHIPEGRELKLVLERTGATIASRATAARSITSKMVGLLGRAYIGEDEALILPGCRSIHTLFMRFAIDILFVDSAWRVIAICKRLPPWRFSPIIWRAHSVIELPAGAAEKAQLVVGECLVCEAKAA